MGIPARIVTGYQGGELNGVDGFWVRAAKRRPCLGRGLAGGRGWVRVDPTGASRPDRIGPFQRLQAPRGLIAGAFGTVNPTLSAEPARRLGGREQQLEPVGAELHAEQAAGPAQEPGLHVARAGRT